MKQQSFFRDCTFGDVPNRSSVVVVVVVVVVVPNFSQGAGHQNGRSGNAKFPHLLPSCRIHHHPMANVDLGGKMVPGPTECDIIRVLVAAQSFVAFHGTLKKTAKSG